MQFALKKDCVLCDIWEPYPFLFITTHGDRYCRKKKVMSFGLSLQIFEGLLESARFKAVLCGVFHASEACPVRPVKGGRT